MHPEDPPSSESELAFTILGRLPLDGTPLGGYSAGPESKSGPFFSTGIACNANPFPAASRVTASPLTTEVLSL